MKKTKHKRIKSKPRFSPFVKMLLDDLKTMNSFGISNPLEVSPNSKIERAFHEIQMMLPDCSDDDILRCAEQNGFETTKDFVSRYGALPPKELSREAVYVASLVYCLPTDLEKFGFDYKKSTIDNTL